MGEHAIGPLSMAEERTAQTLAQVKDVRDFLGVTSAADALDRMYFSHLPLPADKQEYTLSEWSTYRPYVLIFLDPRGEGWSGNAASKGRGNDSYDVLSRVVCYFERATPSGEVDDHAEAERTWKNVLGKIVRGIMRRSGQGGQINATRVALIDCYRSYSRDRKGEGDFQAANLMLTIEGSM